MLTPQNGRQQIRAFAHPDCLTVQIGQAVRVSGCIRFVNGDHALVIRNMDLVGQRRRSESTPLDNDLVWLADLIRQTLLPVKVDPSLLLTAGFFHDLGKVDTYTEHAPYALTPLGKTWKHQVLGLRYRLPLLEHTPSLTPEAGGRLLSALHLIPSQRASSISPEQEVLATLDGLSVHLSRMGSLPAA